MSNLERGVWHWPRLHVCKHPIYLCCKCLFYVIFVFSYLFLFWMTWYNTFEQNEYNSEKPSLKSESKNRLSNNCFIVLGCFHTWFDCLVRVRVRLLPPFCQNCTQWPALEIRSLMERCSRAVLITRLAKDLLAKQKGTNWPKALNTISSKMWIDSISPKSSLKSLITAWRKVRPNTIKLNYYNKK